MANCRVYVIVLLFCIGLTKSSKDGFAEEAVAESHKAFQGELASLQSQMNHQNQLIESLELRNKKREQTIEEQARKIAELEARMASKHSKGASDTPVAFTIFKLDEEYCQEGDLVRFEGVVTNVGAAFAVSNSSFVCPYRGVYVFSISLKMELVSSEAYVQFRAGDNMVLAEVWADGDDQTDLAAGSGAVVVECQVGEVIWISAGGTVVVDGSAAKESVFAGYMLYRYE